MSTPLNSDVLNFLNAQEQGSIAYESGMSFKDCPFTDVQLALAWQMGYSTQELFVESNRVEAVLVWSVEALRSIEEVARSLGQDDIAEKIHFVVSKMADTE